VAADWRDPDHPPRAEAVEATLESENRWTEHALAHILNRRMQGLTLDALRDWLGSDDSAPCTVGVLHGASDPLDGFRAVLAALGLGHSYVGAVPEASPALIPALVDDVRERLPAMEATTTGAEECLGQAEVLVAQEGDRLGADLRETAEKHGLGADRRLIQPMQISAGVVDGHESDDERERMAEDMLLLEGKGRRHLGLVWAPTNHAPDAYLQSMARFRGVYPAHADTPGSLQMHQAFLEAQDQSHAYAEGLAFLVSRGAPEPQENPAHVRWTEYEAIGAMEEWLRTHRKEIYSLIARPHLHDQLPEVVPLRTPGGVHTPPLDDDHGQALVDHLTRTP